MQHDKILTFFDQSQGSCFKLVVGGKQIAVQTETGLTKEESRTQLEKLLPFIPNGSKVEFTVSKSNSWQNSNTLPVYMTADGQRPQSSFQGSFAGNESSYQQGHRDGEQVGYNRGKMEAQLEQMLQKVSDMENEPRGGIDLNNVVSSALPSIAEKLAGSEKGQEFLLKIAAMFGGQTQG